MINEYLHCYVVFNVTQISVQNYCFFLRYASFWGGKFILLRFSRFPDTKKYVSLREK